MKIRVDGKTYQTIYEPFYRIRTHDSGRGEYFKYGIRWPDGSNETLFFGREEDPIEAMKKTLTQLLKIYYLTTHKYSTEYDSKNRENVRLLFGLES